MKKSEIKQGIKEIIEAINTSIENKEEYLQPYEDIEDYLDKIQDIEEENGIETGIDYDMVKSDTLRSCIENSGDIEEIENKFDLLISDLEEWQEEVSENKYDLIQEQYIDVLNEIKDNFEVDSIECGEDLESQLNDMISSLKDMEI